MRETTPAKLVPVAVLLGTMLLMSGCTSRVGGTGQAGDATVNSPSRTTSSTPTSTSTSAPGTATDGTDTSACADADCEILVTGATPIPLDPRFGCSSFVVTFVAPNRLEFQVERTELNPLNAYILGTGYVGLANGVKITIDHIDESGAVLRFTPETVQPGNDVTSGSEGAGSYG